ncbi:hypothetical protein ACHAWC_011914 [Mediolabrus comicus]
MSRCFSSLPSNDAEDEKQQEVASIDTIVLPKLDLLGDIETRRLKERESIPSENIIQKVDDIDQEAVKEESSNIDSSFQRQGGTLEKIYDVLTESPFQQQGSTLENIDGVIIENDASPDQKATVKSDSPKPSLLDLLKTDLFVESWSGPDTDRYRSSRRSQTTTRKGDLSEKYSFETKESSWDSDSLLGKSRSTPTPSPERTKLDNILQQSNELLDSLSKNDGSSTLQLMDFDNVMAQLSRFNSELESETDGDKGEKVWSQGHRENNSLKREAADKCAELLQALERNHDYMLQDDEVPSKTIPSETKHTQLVPNAASYNITLHTIAHSGKGQRVAMEASDILDRMLDRCNKYLEMNEGSSSPLPPPEPTIITFNSAIHAIAKSGADGAGFMAEEIFSKMEDWKSRCNTRNSSHDGSYKGVEPNSRTLACLLDAWSNRDKVKGFSPERAESILNMAINRRRAYVKSVRGEDYDSPILSFDSQAETDHFIDDDDDDDIVEEYVDEDFGDKEAVVEEDFGEELKVNGEATKNGNEVDIEQLNTSCEPFLRPNTVAFNTCINAWATSGRGRMAAERTQELLSQMEAISESGELDLPDADIDNDIGNDGSTLADHSLRPNVRSYSMVMKAWANVHKMERGSFEDAAEQCESILKKMEMRGASDISVRPNLVAYVTTITAWSRTNSAHAASRAENILNRMVDLYYDGDNIELPTLEGDLENAKHDAPFNSVITAYARSSDPNASERAFAVLERLEVSPIAPSVFTYNSVMDVCAKHGDPERALQLLDRMREFSITPDDTSYDTVLNAFARHEESGSAERAWDLLRQWEEVSVSGEDTGFIPSRVSYSSVINGFAVASGKEYGGMHTVKKAKEVYDTLIDRTKNGAIYGDADPVANSCFLNCCANIYGTRSERREALIMAITAFEDMKKDPHLHGEPGQYTFGTMMKACSRLSGDAAEKNRLIESLFQQTCKRGLLSKSTLGQFLRNTPNHFNTKVILNMGGSKREIPSDWHRNVPKWQKPTPTEDNRY